MERGFIADSSDYGETKIGRWVEGAPEKSVWTGIKVKGRRQLTVQTYRCQRCTLLESYAPEN